MKKQEQLPFPQNSMGTDSVSWTIAVQYYAKTGDFRELQSTLLRQEKVPQVTLNSALTETILHSKNSADHFRCAQVLVNKGADLNLTLERDLYCDLGDMNLLMLAARKGDVRLSLIHICRCRRLLTCRSRWSPYH
eukprot:TRINITY_DN6051_c0_g1_i2.p1 TRINITY_DN6051_c0_g1~~TRINITY_DN6051_c0_g1_i2.p1  ORF type:complete len:135 (+),score=25.05 TRINITY_DN6051_c0_g1_i2:127-531(+)